MAQTIIDFLNKIADGLDSQSVEVGFINGATYPDGESVAEIAAKNEYGVPENNQPPRPFFRNAIAEKCGDWKQTLVDGLKAGSSVADVLEIVGGIMVADVRDSINSLEAPALSRITLAMRRARGNKSTKPLLDTRWMYENVTYAVNKKDSE